MNLNRAHRIQIVSLLLLVCATVFARQAAPSIPSTGFPGLDEYRASRIGIYTDDFGQLARYRQDDAALAPAAAGENRVVFLGDSITDYWKLADYFPGKPYIVINRGVDGQSTPEMLVRFRQDVIDLHPRVLVVPAGTNDVAGVTGPTRNEDIAANYASMAGVGARAWDSRGICVAAAGEQLHRGSERVFRAASAR